MFGVIRKIRDIIVGNSLVTNIFCTILIFILIKISYTLLSYEGFYSPIWPVTGINLALVLILGYRIWPSILIASLLSYLNFDIVMTEGVVPAVLNVSNLFIPFNNAIHALVGAWLVRRYNLYPSDFSDPIETLKFYTVAGIIPAILCGTVGNISEFYFNLISGDAFIEEWVTWILADIGSVLIFTTIILALANFEYRRKLVVVAVSSFAFILGYTFYIVAQNWDIERLDLILAQKVTGVEDTIADSIETYNSILYSMNGFIGKSYGLNKDIFYKFSKSVMPRTSSIHSLNWNEEYKFDELEQFQKSIASEYDGVMSTVLFELEDGKFVPLQKRDEYVFVKYFVSEKSNIMEYNVDLYKDPERKAAFNYSKKYRRVSATAPVKPPDLNPGLYVPIYLANYEEEQLLGYSTLVINIEKIFDKITRISFAEDLELRVLDTTDKNRHIPMIETNFNTSEMTINAQSDIAIFNRTWSIQYSKKDSFFERYKVMQPTLIGLLCMLGAAIVSISIVIISGQRLFLERMVQRRTLELAKANNAKSEFMANMSHDLRTPLNAIIGFSEIISKQLYGPIGQEKYKEYAEDIHNSSGYLLDLINDILDLSALEAQKRTINKEIVDIKNLLKVCIRSLDPLIRDKNIEIKFFVEHDVPILYADELALRQILINIIANSIKFTDDGGTITVNVSLYGSGLKIEIIDTGIGISKDNIENILKPFSRVKNKAFISNEGTGLGLSIVNSLINLLGGEFLIKSELQKGTTCTIILPL